MSVRGYVVRVGFAALAFALNEAVLVVFNRRSFLLDNSNALNNDLLVFVADNVCAVIGICVGERKRCDLVNDIHTGNNVAESGVSAVKRCVTVCVADEELAACAVVINAVARH